MADDVRRRAEKRAWDFCAGEHPWEDSCIRCQGLADAFLKWEADAVAQAVREERGRCLRILKGNGYIPERYWNIATLKIHDAEGVPDGR